MVLPPLGITLYGIALLLIGSVRFWRATRGSLAEMIDSGAFWRATQDAFSLRYMRGGGDGCNYPDAAFSHARRRPHHLVFYGFLLDPVSTTIAATYDHLFGWIAPYPLVSLPVVFGTVGGVMLVVGTGGLLALKWRSDREPADRRMAGMDVAFLLSLLLTSLTGLLLLAVRDTAAMGTMLTIHLGLVAALFLTMPYGKFAHLFYRYAALIRNSIEERAGAPAAAGH
jgi:citrate/tricarballylate utilization protein